MKLVHKYPVLGSSVDADSISLTIKSVGLALVPVLVAVLRALDVEVVENDLIQVVTALATVASCVGVIWGVARKFKK